LPPIPLAFYVSCANSFNATAIQAFDSSIGVCILVLRLRRAAPMADATIPNLSITYFSIV
jgi:hypothetical protein